MQNPENPEQLIINSFTRTMLLFVFDPSFEDAVDTFHMSHSVVKLSSLVSAEIRRMYFRLFWSQPPMFIHVHPFSILFKKEISIYMIRKLMLLSDAKCVGALLDINGIVITSSTAQGGGGSFKNRKPIGEVGCSESRMAERIH